MAQAICGQIFSWDTPMWCAGGHEYCKRCPLYKEKNKKQKWGI